MKNSGCEITSANATPKKMKIAKNIKKKV